jgi:uncharacterized protein (DUF1015 family)
VLEEDPEPSVYVYRQSFRREGRDVKRLALFGALRLSSFELGEVLPHEHTHSGPRKDRLALTLATRAQLSPIFLIAPDPAGELLAGIERSTSGDPAFDVVTADGIGHALWPITRSAGADFLCETAGEHPLLIADGHHRYETALAAAAELKGEAGAGQLMVCVVSQRDQGLLIQPTHRSLSRPPGDADASFAWLAALEATFELRPLGRLTPAEAASRVRSNEGILVVIPAESDGEAWMAGPRASALRAAGLSGGEARVPSVLFDRLILERLVGLDAEEAARTGLLFYCRDPESALRNAGANGCGFILPPVAADDVWSIAAAGGRLPPKSTYFEPKMPSGLLFRLI